MKLVASFAAALLTFSIVGPASASSSCDARAVVVVELDVHDGHEVMRINEVEPKSGAAFDDFFQNCARKTVVLASPSSTISQLLNIRFFIGKIGLKASKENFFVFAARPGGRTMTYLETFATIKYTRNKDELLKIIEDPPQESNYL
ncbi:MULTISPECIES: hypothetical protein [unclassified Xanthomonas]|uniref:hypothetical protein n=1 Tax=Xanthomonas sp. LMG 8992 TaxID=1591157 RepID=UPI00136B8436|nr:hypothetical protein [Xanthomonas sp. LMG 8992]